MCRQHPIQPEPVAASFEAACHVDRAAAQPAYYARTQVIDQRQQSRSIAALEPVQSRLFNIRQPNSNDPGRVAESDSNTNGKLPNPIAEACQTAGAVQVGSNFIASETGSYPW